MLNVLLWLPLAAGLLGAAVPARRSGGVAALGALGTLGLAVWLVADFDPGAAGLQHTVNESWIPDLGVRYQLGVDGISIFLVLLTAALWLAATAWSAIRPPERARTWFLMLGLAETATLGAFLAQDLLLFVLFFDLMLIPFYFLFGSWGTDAAGDEAAGTRAVTASQATIKMIVYTLVGSLLMLVAAIATAILTADGGQISFSIAELRANPLGEASQNWLFWFFAAAFLVKMPAFLIHGWMPDAYRVAPLPALAVFSGVLAKVGAYGFLRIVLPIFPAATSRFQEVILLIALASILYGSIMAFTQTNARLVAGYSSMAQLGFITLGIWSLRPDGADGAVLQMVTHGLVVAPLLLIVVVLAERARSDDITRMGGLATRAPVLAAMFLIVTLALLAMPGSANFIGEFYILNGIFQAKIAMAFVAAIGIVLASYYALRLFQAAMHDRTPAGVDSREIPFREGAIVAALVACIVALALHPQVVLKRSNPSVSAQISGDGTEQVARR